MQIGLVGLGKMGFNLALNLVSKGHDVVAYNPSPQKTKKAEEEGVTGTYSLAELAGKLELPRIIWLMVPAGDTVDEVIAKLLPLLAKEDIIIDGGNSNYKDTLRRYEFLKKQDIRFVDVGTSGGMEGARHGACAMIGAEPQVFKFLEPLIKDMCVENGYLHTGPNGSGHFVKMIHNGIEYGMLQAMGEGFEILAKSQFDFNFQEIALVWNHGSVIRGWLMELMERAFSKDPTLDKIKGIMYSSGEGLWTAQTALELGVPAPVITDSVFMRYRSVQDESFGGKVVAALRNEFGGHKVELKSE